VRVVMSSLSANGMVRRADRASEELVVESGSFGFVGVPGIRSDGYLASYLASWAIWWTGSRHDFALDLPPVIIRRRSRLLAR
jgi:hypothetical protein